ncbi:hypothetical protein PC117_g8672 [Phytophthora cactorum]|uniref:Uncharacterized protein n=1 Tax=Phytophthora cactorum TaxID=29920 RepID=A0A8T1DUG1_9STRA|nr:hypothetical protein PC117_g8672 [Phytophthora cactorum]
MTRTNKKRKNPPGSLPDDAAKGPGVKDDGRGEDSEVEAIQVSVEAKTSDPHYVTLAVVPSILNKTFNTWASFYFNSGTRMRGRIWSCTGLAIAKRRSYTTAGGPRIQIVNFPILSAMRFESLSISSQHVRNLLKARLGHGNAVQRLKVVLAELVADTGNACVLLQGEWDQTTGIVLQTKAQREIFSR